MLVGFIGTGNIGNPMARHILEAGHDLVVHDLREERANNLIELGAAWADSPKAVAERCRIVFTSLPGPPEVEAVVHGDNGILAGARPGDIHVDLSTNSVTAVQRLEADARAHGVIFVDAPVTGGVVGAEAGTLTLLASGDPGAVERTRPIMEAFGAHIFSLGSPGTGTLVKQINNVVSLCTSVLVAEVLVLGAKAGLDSKQLYEMLKVGSAGPHVGRMPLQVERKFDNPTFALALAAKDVGLALESAQDLAVPMPMTAAAHQTFLAAMAAGLGEKLHLAALEVLEAGANTRSAQHEMAPEDARP